jgi:hypothetical protein
VEPGFHLVERFHLEQRLHLEPQPVVVGFVRLRVELDALGFDRILGAERVMPLAICRECDVRRQVTLHLR